MTEPRNTQSGVRESLLFAGLALLFSYHVVCGGTFRAMLTYDGRVLNELVFGGLLLAVAIAAAFGRIEVPVPTRALIVMIAAVAWEGSASMRSPYPQLSLEVWGSRVWYVAMAYAAFAFASTPARRLALCGALLVASVWPLLIAAGEFADWVTKSGAAGTIHDQRNIAATLNHSNDFACYLALLLPLALGVFATRALPATVRLGVVALAGAQVFFLGLTLSRSGWLGAAAALFVFYAVSIVYAQVADRPRVLAKLVVCILFVGFCFRLPSVAIKLLSPQAKSDWQTTRLAAGRDYGFTQRLVFWRGMARMVRERPLLGWGVGMIPLNYPRFADPHAPNELPFHAHNLFIQAAVEGGLGGLALWTLATTMILFAGVRSLLDAEPSERPVLLGALAALVGYLACGLGQANHANPAIHVIPMMLGGVMARSCSIPSTLSNRRYSRLVFFLAASAVVTRCFIQYFYSYSNFGLKGFDAGVARLDQGEQWPFCEMWVEKADPIDAAYCAATSLVPRPTMNHENSLMQARKAVAAFRFDPVLHSNLGWLQLKDGNRDGARRSFLRATELDAARPAYWLALAVVETKQGKLREAETHLRRATEIIPPEPRALWMLAEQLARTGNFVEAVRCGQRALDLLAQGEKWKQGLHIPTRYYRIMPKNESLDELPPEPSRAGMQAKLVAWCR